MKDFLTRITTTRCQITTVPFAIGFAGLCLKYKHYDLGIMVFLLVALADAIYYIHLTSKEKN